MAQLTVQLREERLIAPPATTAASRMPLSPVDDIMPRYPVQQMFVFERPSSNEEAAIPIDRVHAALVQLVTRVPVLAGRLALDPGTGRLRVAVDAGVGQEAGGLLLRDAATDATLATLRPYRTAGFPVALRGDPMIPAAVHAGTAPAVVIQRTGFACGGATLAIMAHHALVDGPGLGALYRLWTAIAQGRPADTWPLALADRDVLTERSATTLPDGWTPPAYKVVEPKPPAPTPAPATGPVALPPMRVVDLQFEAATLERLKAVALAARSNAESLDLAGDATFVSLNDALSTHIWRLVTRARGLATDAPTRLGMAVDARKRFAPPLPVEYTGNVNLYATCAVPAAVLGVQRDAVAEDVETVDARTLAVAWRVRQAVDELTDARLRATVGWLATMPVITSVQPSFQGFLGADLAITNWAQAGLNDADFGTGLPAWTGPGPMAGAFDGLAIFNARPGGGYTVVLGLRTDHMDRLLADPLFLRYPATVL